MLDFNDQHISYLKFNRSFEIEKIILHRLVTEYFRPRLTKFYPTYKTISHWEMGKLFASN